MLVTDGVVEAREASGALLGFERTAALSVESAEAVAEVAQRFGQDDDITVLTVLRGRREASRGGERLGRARGFAWRGEVGGEKNCCTARAGADGAFGVGTVWTGGCF